MDNATERQAERDAEAEADAMLLALGPPRPKLETARRSTVVRSGSTRQLPPIPHVCTPTVSGCVSGSSTLTSRIEGLEFCAVGGTWQEECLSRLQDLSRKASKTRDNDQEQWTRLHTALTTLHGEVVAHHSNGSNDMRAVRSDNQHVFLSHKPEDKELLRPWYTSRTNSYMVSGAAMGQADRDILNLRGSFKGASTKSQMGDSRSVAGLSQAGRTRSPSIALSYTSYADIEDPDQHEETVSLAKSHKADLLFHFDEEAQFVLELIFLDKDKTFGFEEKKKKKKGGGGIVAMVKSAIDDLLLPPAMRPQWEKEQAAMKKERDEEERLKQLKMERDWKRAGGLKDDEDEEKTAAARLIQMKKALGKDSGERVPFDAAPVNGYREQGRFGTTPLLNIDYIRKSKFQYQGQRFGGQRDGQGSQVYTDDYTYEGEWLLNLRQGFGSLNYPDGSHYEGQFYESKQHGFGVLKGMDGKHYKGAWECGKKHGFGEMPDRKRGLIFSGQWVAGKRHGFGIQLDLKSGDVYAGQWEFGLKNGEGVLKQWNPSIGAMRIRMEWEKGKLIKQEAFDALKHGTEVGEAAMWASHYSKECAMDAELTVAQRISYPEHPVRPKVEVDYQVQQAQEQAEALEAEEAARKEQEIRVEENKIRVPAVEFRRLITLVHSSDKVVEELVVPILDDAQPVAGTETEEDGFLVGPIWDENLLKLSHHYAIKIQRQWRRTGMRRMVKVAREEAAEHIETEQQRGERLAREVLEKRRAEERAILNTMELEQKPVRDLQEACNLAVTDEDNRGPVELLQKTRQLFRLEQVVAPGNETRSRMLVAEKLSHRLAQMKKKGGMWAAGRKQMMGLMTMLNVFKNDQNGVPAKSLEDVKSSVALKQAEEDLFEDIAENMDLDLSMVKYKDGSRFFGEVYGGLPHGYGASMNPDGSNFFGQHQRGHRHGLGVYTVPEGDDLNRVYSGEWNQGRRHGFAIERMMWKKKVCKWCVVSEYEADVRINAEPAQAEDHPEWLDACDKAQEQARGAKIEAESNFEEENNEKTLTATQKIEFDWRAGLNNYTGHFNELGQRHGLGIQTWHDGQDFAGMFANDVPHGSGRESYPNRTHYIGNFKEGKRHGWGQYHAANGIIYLGQWQDGLRHGFALEREERGGLLLWIAYVKYERNSMILLDSVNPKKAKTWWDDAETSIRLAARTASEAAPPTRIEYPEKNSENALVYIGGILDEQRAGVGVLTHKNGTRYIGEFMSDKKHGLGVETYSDESTYKGQFSHGARHGWGEYFDAKSERRYRGNWTSGLRHGYGWERAVLNMISGKIYKEFLIEYDRDREVGRRFITKASKLEFLDDVLKMVKRAEEVQDITVEIYEELID